MHVYIHREEVWMPSETKRYASSSMVYIMYKKVVVSFTVYGKRTYRDGSGGEGIDLPKSATAHTCTGIFYVT